MSANALYPDWVMKYKKKGTYISKTKDGKYYLYKAHSERVKGTNKVNRVFDGYIGRITEEDGLIPVKDKVEASPVIYEVGLSYAVLNICTNIQDGFVKRPKDDGLLVYCMAILTFIYGTYNEELFNSSYLSIHFKNKVSFPKAFTKDEISEIKRGSMMISTYVKDRFGEDTPVIVGYLNNVRLLYTNNRYYLSFIPESAEKLFRKHGITWKDPLWQKKMSSY